MVKKINIGSGIDIRNGWDNLDNHNSNGANIIADLNNLPLPILDNTYDYVFCSHVLEDFNDPIPIIDEFVRITKPNGKIEIRVPSDTGSIAWGNIYHKRCYNIHSFVSYVQEQNYGRRKNLKILVNEYYFDKNNYTPLSWCSSRIRHYGAKVYNLIGKLSYNLIEDTILKYLLPNLFIRVVYQKQ